MEDRVAAEIELTVDTMDQFISKFKQANLKTSKNA